MRSSKVTAGLKGRISQYNKLRADAQAASYLLAHELDTPSLQLYVEGGSVYFGSVLVEYNGGNSPTFTAPSGNPRIDLLTIKNDGTLQRIIGTEGASPITPILPLNVIPIAEIYNRVGQSKILDEDDSINGFILTDLRQYVSSPLPTSTILPFAANINLSVYFSDNFTRVNNITVGNGWVEGFENHPTNFQIQNNEMVMQGSAGAAYGSTVMYRANSNHVNTKFLFDILFDDARNQGNQDIHIKDRSDGSFGSGLGIYMRYTADGGVGACHIDIEDNGVTKASATSTVFDASTYYRVELGIAADNSIELRWWKRETESRPNSPNLTVAAFTPISAGSNFAISRIQGNGNSRNINIDSFSISQFQNTNVQIPTGFFLCDGSAISRTIYANLFSLIGTFYGIGDGVSTFNLPDLRGRIIAGQDVSQIEFQNAGQVGGEKTHVLTASELASHNHPVTYQTDGRYTSGGSYGDPSGGAVGSGGPYTSGKLSTAATGDNVGHNNLQPYVVLNYIIKY